MSETRTIECPHWEPGSITLRKGCTACADEQRRRAYQAGEWCGECAFGVVEEPPCCTLPETHDSGADHG